MYIHSVVVYQKYGRNDNFRAKARKLSILSTELDIFDILRHYIYVFSIYGNGMQ